MGQEALDRIFTQEEQQAIKNEGYQAHAASKNLVDDNPYSSHEPKHWLWRAGYLEAFKDSNGM